MWDLKKKLPLKLLNEKCPPRPLVFECFGPQLVVQFGRLSGCGLIGGGMSLEAWFLKIVQPHLTSGSLSLYFILAVEDVIC